VGTDVILDPEDLEASFSNGRNFANKLWNIGRFILSNLDGPVRPLAGKYATVVRRDELTLADRWIIARCEATVVEATDAYQRFRLNEAALAIYRFLWNDLADWYVESIKPRLYGEEPGGDVARAVVTQTFDVALRLLHPIMPFITETLWKRLPGRTDDASISVAHWPLSDPRAADAEAVAQFSALQELTSAIRAIRSEYNVQPSVTVRATVTEPGPAVAAAIRQLKPTVERLATVSALAVPNGSGGTGDAAGAAHAVLSDGTSITVPLGDLVDLAKECARLTQEADRLQAAIRNQEQKLANEQFVSRAPAPVVEREREKLASWKEQIAALAAKRERLGCSG
jgi:valyl-tRNA synthetase